MSVTKRVEPLQSLSRMESAWPRRLTVEAMLYIAITIAAALVRLWALDDWPLRMDEAEQALGAWNLARGSPAGTNDYSPLLMTGNFVLFSLFRATDATARLWPAIFGIVLTLVPALLRRQLGRAGALIASLLLAFSPTVTFASRSLDGRIVAVAAGLLIAAALFHWMDTGKRNKLVLAMLGFVIGLLSAPIFYALLLILVLGAAGLWMLRKPLGLEETFGRWAETWTEVRGDAGWWRRLGFLALALLLLLSTGFFFNLDGLGAGAGLLPAWLRSFAWRSESFSPLTVLWGLALYETVLVIFGIAGIVLGWKRREPYILFVGWWALAGLILSLAAGGWQPVDLVLVSVPLAVLAGRFLGHLLESVSSEPLMESEWLLVMLTIPLAVHSYLEFSAYSINGRPAHLFFAFLLPTLLFCVVLVLVGLWAGWRRAGRGLSLAVALVGAALFVSHAWSSNHNTDPARYDLLSLERTDVGVRDLVAVIERYSAQQMGDTHAAPILVVGRQWKWLKWPLRDFHEVNCVDLFESAGHHQVVISPLEVEPPLGELYVGHDMAIRSAWRPAGLKGRILAQWLLYRTPPQAAQKESIILWVQRTPSP